MKKLTIELPPERQIEINGIVFDVLASDVEILEMLTGIVSDCGKLAETSPIEEITGVLKRTFAVLDKILGNEAAKRILNGRTANVNFMLESVISPILSEVLNLARESYDKRILEEYGTKLGGESAKGISEER